MQEESIEIQAKKALSEPNFAHFFNLLAKIPSEYTRTELALEAVKVASLHRNVEVLRQLANFDIESFDTEELFDHVLQALLDLKSIDVAFSVVILGNEKLKVELRWYLLAKTLLKNNNYILVKKIFIYIKDNYHRYDIAKICLDSIKPEDALFEWIEWLDHFAQTERYIDTNRIIKIVAILSSYHDFPTVCTHLKAMQDTECKKEIIYKLYMMFMLGQETIKLQALEQILSEELRWLVHVRLLLEGEPHFDVIVKIKHAEATAVIPLVVSALVQRQLQLDDERLAKSIMDAAEATQTHAGLMLTEGCRVCFQNNRLDAVILLISKLDQYLRMEQLLTLISKELRVPQYHAILRLMPRLTFSPGFYESDEEKILKRIPSEIIAEERKRRTQQIVKQAETDFSNLDKVSSKHAQFENIHRMIERLFEYGALAASLALARKLVQSNRRDNVVRKLLHRAIAQSDFAIALESSRLLPNNQDRQLLPIFIQHYQANRYRKALKVLTKPKQTSANSTGRNNVGNSATTTTVMKKIDFHPEYSELIYDCIEKTFASEDEGSVIQFLEAIGIFELPESYHLRDEASTLKNKVVNIMITRCRDHKARRRLIERLNSYQRTSIMAYALQAFINQRLLIAVIDILNITTKNKEGDVKLPEKIKKLIEDFLQTQQPTIELLKSLLGINAATIRQGLIRRCLWQFSLEIAKETFTVIVLIPDAELKTHYLLESIILAIVERDFDFAQRAVLHLTHDQHKTWGHLIVLANQNKYVEMLNVVLAEVIENPRLQTWTIEHWLNEITSSNELLHNAQNFLQWLQSLEIEKPPFDRFDKWHLYYAKQRLYEALARRTVQTWHKLLQKSSAYRELIHGYSLLMPAVAKTNLRQECLRSLHEMATALTVISAPMTLVVVKLLLPYENPFPECFLSELIEKFLKINDVASANELIQLMNVKNSYMLDSCSIKIAERYFKVEDYQAVINLLRAYTSSYSVRPVVLGWVMNLITNSKFNQANILVKELLPSLREEEIVRLIEALMSKKYLVAAARYLQDIHTPATKLRLQQSMRSAYQSRLSELIGEVHANKLFQLHQQVTEYLQLIVVPEHKDKANHLKNEIIVELRSLLDRAFLAFYREKYGVPPPRVNVYFPVVPKLQRPSIKDELQFYFNIMLKTPKFLTDFPELFDYLLYIQPLSNPSYQWLGYLYRFANLQKHDNELPPQPIIDAAEVNMVEYLPQLLNGGTELLLKLFQWRCDLRAINDLRFTVYVPLQPQAVSAYNPMLFGPASPPRAKGMADIRAKAHEFRQHP